MRQQEKFRAQSLRVESRKRRKQYVPTHTHTSAQLANVQLYSGSVFPVRADDCCLHKAADDAPGSLWEGETSGDDPLKKGERERERGRERGRERDCRTERRTQVHTREKERQCERPSVE